MVKSMTKTRIMPLSLLILFVFTTSASAKVKMIDIVHLTDGSIVTGEIIETVPNEVIKIKTHVLNYSYEGVFYLRKPNNGK